MTEDKPRSGAWPAVGALGSVVAPLVAALTGTIYLAGWGQRQTLMSRFGLTSSHFSESIQSTLARGYLPFVTAAVPVALVAAFVWLVWIREGAPWGDLGSKLSKRIGRALDTAYRWSWYSFFAITILFMGLVSGTASGNLIADRTAQRVADGCRRECFVYVASNRQVVGVLLAEDSERMAVLAAGGVALLDAAEVRTVSAYSATPARPATPPRP